MRKIELIYSDAHISTHDLMSATPVNVLSIEIVQDHYNFSTRSQLPWQLYHMFTMIIDYDDDDDAIDYV